MAPASRARDAREPRCARRRARPAFRLRRRRPRAPPCGPGDALARLRARLRRRPRDGRRRVPRRKRPTRPGHKSTHLAGRAPPAPRLRALRRPRNPVAARRPRAPAPHRRRVPPRGSSAPAPGRGARARAPLAEPHAARAPHALVAAARGRARPCRRAADPLHPGARPTAHPPGVNQFRVPRELPPERREPVVSVPRTARARGWVAGLAVALLALAAAPVAAAHSSVSATQPANDAVVQEAPDRVSVIYTEPVETAFGALRVYDSAARRVDTGELLRPSPDTVAVALEDGLPDGTYTVTWQVISADSHPIHGAFVFHIGAPGANAAGIAEQVENQGIPQSVNVSAGIVRFAGFGALILAAGGVIATPLLLRRRRRAGPPPPLGDRRRSGRAARALRPARARPPGGRGRRLLGRRGGEMGRRLGRPRHALRPGDRRAHGRRVAPPPDRARDSARWGSAPATSRSSPGSRPPRSSSRRGSPGTRASAAASRSSPMPRTSPPPRSGSAASRSS